MTGDMIQRLRKILIDEISKFNVKPLIRLSFDQNIMQQILFDNECFSSVLENVRDVIDFSNVSFDGFDAKGFDFSKLYGVKIDSQKLYCKDLSYADCLDVEFIDTFEDVSVKGSNLEGSNYKEMINFEETFRRKIQKSLSKSNL